MMKNISILKLSLKTLQNARLLVTSHSLINIPKFNFGAKKIKSNMVDDLLKKDSKAIDQDSLSDNVTRSQLYNDKTVGQDEPQTDESQEARESLMSAIQDNKPMTTEKITTKILCELIGSKHYPSNEEIEIPRESVVTVYDENDKLLGNMFLYQALENAEGLDKDIVLRNDKVKPPLVKMMKYRVELVKRLFKKLGKNLGKDLNDKQATKHKIFGFSLRTQKNDFDSKVDKLRVLLAENNYVKVVMPVDLDSNDQILRANQILKNIAGEVTQMAKIRAGPIKQKKTKEHVKSLDPSISSSIEEITHHDAIIKDAYESAAITEIETEKDLDYVDSVYIELESLIVDNTGIDYEKLLKTSNLDTLVRGVTHSNVISEINQASQESASPLSKENIEDRLAQGIATFSKSGDLSLKKQLQMLEKEAVVQHDFPKRIRIQEKIDNMREELNFTEMKYNARLIKYGLMNITRRSAEKEGILDRNKA
jgi:translation initiation factor IF-3